MPILFMGFSNVWNLQGSVRLAPPVQGSLGSCEVLPAEVLNGLQLIKSATLPFGLQELH